MAKKSHSRALSGTATFGHIPFVSGPAFFLVLSVIAVMVSALNPAAFSFARMAVYDTLAPVLLTLRQPFDSVAVMIGSATGLAELRAENVRLLEENERLRAWYQKAIALEVENKALQSLLNVEIAPELEFQSVRLLSDTSNAYVKSIMILAGSQTGVTLGSPVLSAEGVLGRIVETGDHTARVLLLSDLNARTPVVVEGSNAHAILAGANHESPRLTHMPEDTMFQAGDRLVTSGLGGVYPAGLPVGVIHHVSQDGIAVRLYAGLENTHFVRVLKTR